MSAQSLTTWTRAEKGVDNDGAAVKITGIVV